jgi:hypothetical protein
VLLAAFGGMAAWLLELALAAMGRAVVVPPFTIAVVLFALGVIVAVMAWPVRKVSRGVPGAKVDPFYATRVVVLAKASSLGGSLLAGAGVGILAYLLSRSVVPGVGSIAMSVAMTIGAVLLVVGGLLAEHWCMIPPEDDDGTAPDPQGTT